MKRSALRDHPNVMERWTDIAWFVIATTSSPVGRISHSYPEKSKSTVLVDQIDLLRAAFRAVKRAHPFQIDAMVILPEHLHAFWTLPPEDNDYSGRWHSIKAQFTRSLATSGHLWYRRFWEHTIRDDEDQRRHVEYVHFKPVRHGHVARVRDWPYSTFHRYVCLGMHPLDWGPLVL